MNFVRFVKTPRLDVPSKPKSNAKAPVKKPAVKQLSMILTITIDFSFFAGATELACQLISSKNEIVSERQVQWHEYDREVKIELNVPAKFKEGRVVVTPVNPGASSKDGEFLRQFLGEDITHLIGIETEEFALDTLARQDTVYRMFSLRGQPLRIAEQSGETIIRHVWDAGIMLSAALTCRSLSALPDELQDFVSTAMNTSKMMRILEVGCGVGILGVSIAAALPQCQVIMTDLSDAKPLVEQNIQLNLQQFPHLQRNTQFRELDWETNPYPEWTVTENFDLIVMADVTYNTATFIALADTLEHLLRHGSKGSKVICCGKRRHDEEEGFWKLVRKRGFTVEKRVVYAMDLDGNFRHCQDAAKMDGEQLIDFISMHL